MKKIPAAGVTLAPLFGTGASPVRAMSGGGSHGGGGGHGSGGHEGGGHSGFRGPRSFHADRFERHFFGRGLRLGVLGSALLIAPTVDYAPATDLLYPAAYALCLTLPAQQFSATRLLPPSSVARTAMSVIESDPGRCCQFRLVTILQCSADRVC